MISNYGYCDKEGYGYVKYIIENYNIDNNLTIINKNPSPGIYSLLKLKNDKNDDKIVLINFPETIDGNIFDQQIKKYWSDESYIDISKFKLIHQYGNCYYLRR